MPAAASSSSRATKRSCPCETRRLTQRVLAAGIAARRFQPEELVGFSLYSSAEPCAMCAGAIYWSGIGRLVFGLAERDLRLLTGNHPANPTMDLPCRQVLASGQRNLEVLGPELVDEAGTVFEGYWG